VFKKLAHVRALGYGNRAWAGAIYSIPGVSPSHPAFNLPEVAYDEGFHTTQAGGMIETHVRQATTAPTMSRNATIGSQFSSLAALPVFQSFANLHWSQNMGALMARPDHPALNVDNNPNQYGSKEQQRGTSYNPWPSAGALYPKVI